MNLAAKKQATANQYVAASAELLRLAADIDNLVAVYFTEGFNTGANAFVDADFNTGANQQLTAAKISAFITAAQTIQTALPAGTRDNLRKMLTSGIP